jgi:hypothetical protein
MWVEVKPSPSIASRLSCELLRNARSKSGELELAILGAQIDGKRRRKIATFQGWLWMLGIVWIYELILGMGSVSF